jgi:DNA polymerase-3 subunit epsilon
MTGYAPNEFDHAARVLASHPDFRILRRLQPSSSIFQGPPLGPQRMGIVVDVETTGLDHNRDRIIELAVQRFNFDMLGRITQLDAPQVWREDPGVPLDAHITQLTGLTNQDLVGQSIDQSLSTNLIASADLVIAHNAAFDRPFIERRLPAAAGKSWACSMVEPEWLALGF